MRATRAYIHLDRLAGNVDCARRLVGEAALCVEVKANGYGHGLVEVGSFLARMAARGGWGARLRLGVATVDEAVALRECGVRVPILLFSYADDSELEALYEYNVEPVVGDVDYCLRLEEAGRAWRARGGDGGGRGASGRRGDGGGRGASGEGGGVLGIHLKIDSGMGRLGCRADEVARLYEVARGAERVRVAALCTHLADAGNRGYTARQVEYFEAACARLEARGVVLPRHCANSGAILEGSAPHYDMVRPGIMVYGYDSDPAVSRVGQLGPVMELRSKIALLKRVEKGETISYGMTWRSDRRTTIAVVPVGYGDGYTRRLSGSEGARVLVMAGGEGDDAGRERGVGHQQGGEGAGRERGGEGGAREAPVVGRICMDQCMVDVGDVPGVARGQEIVLFGDAEGRIGADTIARYTGTIAYEVTSGIQGRVPRIYVGDGVAS